MQGLDLTIYPGGELIQRGLADLRSGTRTRESMLVLIGAHRLTALGFELNLDSGDEECYEHALYSLLEEEEPTNAYSTYNALLKRLASFLESYGSSR